MSEKKIISILVLLFALIAGVCPAYGGKNESEGLWELGEKAYEAGRYMEALSYYKKSLSKCAGDIECESSNLNAIGRVYEALDEDKNALPYYEKALAASRKINDRNGIAVNLFNVGAIYSRTFNQYEKALNLFEESLKICRELNDREGIAIVLFNMGKTLNSTGRYEKALSVLNEALKINKEINNLQAVAANLNSIGSAYSGLGQYDKALSYFQEALKINRQLDIPGELSWTLKNIGDVYCDLKKHDQALSYYEEALNIQKKHNLKFDMAITINNIGSFYQDMNQYDKAISYFERALKISREIDNSALVATNLNNLGNTYSSIGKSDIALSYYQKSLELEKQLNRPQFMTMVLNNIGMEYLRVGQYERALYYLNEALKIDRKLDNPHNIELRLNNIGAVYLRMKKYKEAEKIFLERIELEKRVLPNRLVHPGLETVYILTKQYSRALDLLAMPYRKPTWRSNPNYSMEYYTNYGNALKGKGRLRESAGALLKAVSISEEIRQEVSEKEGFFAGGGYISRLMPHRLLVSVLAERAMRGEVIDEEFKPYGKDFASAAFYYSELTKARAFLESMAKKYTSSDVPNEIKVKEDSILKQLSEIKGNWERVYKMGEAAFNSLLKKKERVYKELNSLITEIRTKYPGYAALKYPKPFPADELPLKGNEVLIEFAITGDEGYVFVVRNGGVSRIYRINIDREALEEKVRAFMQPLVAGKPSEFSISASKELYDILLADPLRDIKETERVIIVPDGILGLLSFEALAIHEGKDLKNTMFVGDRWTITYAQSATTFALTRFLKPATAVKPLFAIGNPIYDKSDPRYIAHKQGESQPLAAKDLKQYAYRGVTVVPKPEMTGEAIVWEDVIYTPLLETEEEIREIAKLFSVSPEFPDILLGISASETNFRKAPLRDYRYLHFATHADLPGKVQGIKEPFIILGQVENRGKDDGFLTLSEVLELRFDAEMVVLSACSTGRGKLMEGEGVANFARAFQHAGARSVVVSLWEVASEPAVEYMEAFYGHLKAGKSRAEALRLARNTIKAKYPNPFYWAPFILHGEGY